MARREKLTDEHWAVLETLIPPSIRRGDGRGRPERLVGDRAYDSDPLDQKLAQIGIELIAPQMQSKTCR